MKEFFEKPQLEVQLFSVEDILTTSDGYAQPTFDGYAPDSDDSEFG